MMDGRYVTPLLPLGYYPYNQRKYLESQITTLYQPLVSGVFIYNLMLTLSSSFYNEVCI